MVLGICNYLNVPDNYDKAESRREGFKKKGREGWSDGGDEPLYSRIVRAKGFWKRVRERKLHLQGMIVSASFSSDND